jgi:hypothetical protein
MEEEDKKDSPIKAKTVSLLGQIFASIWVGGWSAYKFITTGNIEVQDVIFSGIAIAGCFSPVYFSIIMDKLKEIKIGR